MKTFKKWFKDLKIQSKLLLAFGILISVMALLAALFSAQFYRINSKYGDLISSTIKRHDYISKAVTDMEMLNYLTLTKGYLVMIGADSEQIETLRRNYDQQTELFLIHMSEYRGNVANESYFSAEEKQERFFILDEAEYLFTDEYQKKMAGFYESLHGDNKEMNLFIEETLRIGDSISAKLEILANAVSSTVEEKTAETTAQSRNTILLCLCISILLVAFSVSLAIFMIRKIKAPIVRMKNAMLEISKGDLAYPIRSESKDELGLLANQIGEMVDNIAEINKVITVIDNLDNMVQVIDLDYNLIYANHAAGSTYGFDAEACKGQKCYKTLRGLDEPCAICQMPGLLSDKGLLLDKENLPSCNYEFLYDDVLGEWIGGKAAIIRWIDGSNVYFQSSFIETEKKMSQEQLSRAAIAAENASMAKSQFLANMSHEIRTPMNSIIGFAELALDSGSMPQVKGYLGKISDSTKWLLHIVNDILDISKIESGKVEIENVQFDLYSIFMRCQSVILPGVYEKDLDLHVYAEPLPGKKLLGDPVRLYQALMNLLSNAVKFTAAGQVKFSSLIQSTTDNTATVHFEVSDSGIGMSPEQIERVYEPFMQGDSSTTRNYGGTGLGLTITKNIIELMGGVLQVESTQGAGSTFSFDLVFETVDAPEIAVMPADITVIEKPMFDSLILVCEDNHMNQQLISEHLERVGIRAMIAENGKVGVEMVEERIRKGEAPFDLIFMDMFMPVMDGLEATSKIMALGTGAPIVAMTANIMSSETEKYKKNGMSGYVGKPFTTQELWRCLLKHLKPVSISVEDAQKQAREINELQNKLKLKFVKENQTRFDEITEAMYSDDLILAHRLAHSLKGNAGMIGKTSLQRIAAEVEGRLKAGELPDSEQMEALENELISVLEELAPLLEKSAVQTGPTALTSGQALALFDRLEPMLESINPECADLLDEIRAIPGTENLAQQIEDYDFEAAMQTLADIKKGA